jgi:hypothetical protein
MEWAASQFHLFLSHLRVAPATTVRPARLAEAKVVAATPCRVCGHGHREHVDGACQHDEFDFFGLTHEPCGCARYVRAA